MSWSDGLRISRVGRNVREWPPIEDCLGLDDRSAEGVVMHLVPAGDARKGLFEEADDAFPDAAIMRCGGGNEVPLYSFLFEG